MFFVDNYVLKYVDANVVTNPELDHIATNIDLK
jgi:hypothetical protein